MKTIFGTCGVRRKFTEEFSGPQWLEIGMAIGTYLGKDSSVLIGRDTRQTAELVQYAIISGLVSCGCAVHVLHGSAESPYVTTSTIAYATKHFNADAGIQVTASHNTPEYIGIKIWQKSGMGFTPAQEKMIDGIFASKKFRLARWNEILKVKTMLNANSIHLSAILDLVKPPLQFPDGNITIAVDPGNGAACEIAPRLLQKLGVNVVSINAQPDGLFPGRHSEPTNDNIKTLIKMVKNDEDIHLGIAFDGDADRVRFVDGTGRLIEGDRILLLFTTFLVKQKKIRGPCIVTPVNSSSILEKYLEPLGISVSRTRIGDINVAMRIQELNATIGGEISGTYTWPQIHLGPDSLFSMAKLVEIISREGMLEVILDEIPCFKLKHENLEIPEHLYEQLTLDSMEADIRECLGRMGIESPEINRLDGILFKFNGGFLLARLSGTSPLLRLSCENEDENKAIEILEGVSKVAKKWMRHSG